MEMDEASVPVGAGQGDALPVATGPPQEEVGAVGESSSTSGELAPMETGTAAVADSSAPEIVVHRQRVIKAGDSIILCVNDEKYLFVEVQPHGTVNINKRRYGLNTFIGAPYPSLWDASRKGNKLIPLKEKPRIQAIADIDPLEDAEIKTDNRDLVDNNQSQKLTQQEIVEMQEKGASGESIIKALIQNSATYQNKTEFSKAKYLKKKAKKHIQVVEVLEPSLVNIATAYFIRKASSICHMRVDSLARLLTFSDARAGTNVLVLESCKGLVTGAVAERVGGHGKIVSLHIHGRSDTSAIDLFNFPPEVKESILHTSLSSLRELYRALGKPDPAAGSDADRQPEAKTEPAKATNKSAAFAPMDQLKSVFAEGFDSLVIVTKAIPSPFVFGLLPFLKPASPFVIFSPFMQHLVECYTELHDAEEAINLQLSETWMRQYQVLPSRTRPPMNMNGASGFLLTGTKVHKDTTQPSASTGNSSGSSSGDAGVTAASPQKKKARTET